MHLRKGGGVYSLAPTRSWSGGELSPHTCGRAPSQFSATGKCWAGRERRGVWASGKACRLAPVWSWPQLEPRRSQAVAGARRLEVEQERHLAHVSVFVCLFLKR